MPRQSLHSKVFARYLKQDIKEVRRRADTLTAYQSVPILQAFSSGPYSLGYLAKVGHPYAKARPNPAFNPGVINTQTGKFKRSWRVRPGSLNNDPVIDNTDPVGKFLEFGTRFMVARPVDILAMLAIDPLRRSNLDQAFRALAGKQ
jgi:hypothetical protein